MYSSLRLNLKKSEAGWLGRENIDPPRQSYDIKWIDFHQKGIRILGIYFSYNDKFFYDNNFKRILTNFQTTLSIWRSRTLTLYGKIQVLRSLALPKLLYVCSVIYASEDFIKIVESTIKDFIWNEKKPKIKHSTLIGDYSKGGLKLPDFRSCLKANQVKWTIRLILSCKEKAQLSIIPSTYLQSIGGFQQINNNFDRKRIPENIPSFYRSVLTTWSEIAEESISEDPLILAREQYLWNNKHIKVGNESIFYKDFSELGINKVADLYDENMEFKWPHAKSKGLKDKDFLRWVGIIHAMPSTWKKQITENRNAISNEVQTKKCLQIENKKIDIDKIKTKQIYQWFINLKFRPHPPKTI